LVLVIEATQGKSDLLAKCYTCRQDIQKACVSLQAVQPSSPADQESSDLLSLDDDIQKQEAVVKQLDGQRVAIVSLLQRGKDLQHHAGAPEFLAEQVLQLETVWNYTFDMANEKLKKLKGMMTIFQFSFLLYNCRDILKCFQDLGACGGTTRNKRPTSINCCTRRKRN
jgi:hypothetical protein